MVTQRNDISILHSTGSCFATRRHFGGTSANTSATKRAKCWHGHAGARLARACWRGHFGAGMLARASKYMAIRGSLPVPASNRANPDFCTKGCGHDRWLAEELAELFDFPAVVSVILAGGNGGGGGCPHPSGVPAPHPAWPVPVRWRHVVSRRWIWRVWLRQFTCCRFSSGASFPRAPSLLSHCWGMN